MDHTQSQERTWNVLKGSLREDLHPEYAVREIRNDCLKCSRSIQPIRAVILNFGGTDISVNYEEGGRPPKPSVGSPIRVEEDGTLRELSDNSLVNMSEISLMVRKYLAA